MGGGSLGAGYCETRLTFLEITSDRIPWLGARVFRIGVKPFMTAVSPAPAECGTQQKFSFLRISNPAEEKGRAYSSSVGSKVAFSSCLLSRSRNRLRNAGNLRFMSM